MALNKKIFNCSRVFIFSCEAQLNTCTCALSVCPSVVKTEFLTCLKCGGMDLKAVYDGESGRSGYYRTTEGHKADIEKNKGEKSALAKHTGLFHQDKVGDTSIYGAVVNNTTKSSLLCQVREGQSILDNAADIVLNGKGEWHVGAVPQARTAHATRDLRRPPAS